MISIEFTESEKQALHYERFHHPHPRVQRKMETVWLKSHQLPHHKIAELGGIFSEHRAQLSARVSVRGN